MRMRELLSVCGLHNALALQDYNTKKIILGLDADDEKY